MRCATRLHVLRRQVHPRIGGPRPAPVLAPRDHQERARQRSNDYSRFTVIPRCPRFRRRRSQRNCPLLQIQVRHGRLFGRVLARDTILLKAERPRTHHNVLVSFRNRSARRQRDDRPGRPLGGDHHGYQTAHAPAHHHGRRRQSLNGSHHIIGVVRHQRSLDRPWAPTVAAKVNGVAAPSLQGERLLPEPPDCREIRSAVNEHHRRPVKPGRRTDRYNRFHRRSMIHGSLKRARRLGVATPHNVQPPIMGVCTSFCHSSSERCTVL